MRIALAIATANRQDHLERTLTCIAEQTRAPDAIYVCTPNIDAAQHFIRPELESRFAGSLPKIIHLTSAQGLTRQRNAILNATLSTYDVLTFIDDDFLPAQNYLQIVENEFAQNSDCSVLMGHVPFDGARNEGYSFDEGRALLKLAQEKAAKTRNRAEQIGAYGCNMSIRLDRVGAIRFDEKLPLYGWQEDIDFTSQLRPYGKIICPEYLVGVHLGARNGRSSGLRLGYSQVMNPIYLIRKGTMPPAFGIDLMLRNFGANIIRSLRPEPHIDRRGRLLGNIRALLHLARGRIEPEHILSLK